VLLKIPLGSPIRILTVGQTIIEGRLVTLSDTGIVIRQRSDSSRASIARIATIWRPARNVKSGVITGGLVGAVVGALALGTLASGFCERADCHGAFADGATVGAAFGSGVGAIVGIGVGALTHHWKRVWPWGPTSLHRDDR
jgi:F0F1-type ATP synthase assembly protein I